jgi:DnaJ-class molecular chaperone
MKITHQTTVQLTNGTSALHTAELLSVFHSGDGSSTAVAACCGKVGNVIPCPSCSGAGRDCPTCHGNGSIKDEDSRSHYTFYDVAEMSNDELTAKIQAHVERVANHHAGAHRARDFMASLTAAANPAPAAPEIKVS